MDIIDTGNAGPEFVLAKPWCRPGGLGARIRSRPLIAGHTCRGVRGVFEHVVGAVELAGLDGDEFRMNREHGVAEAVEFGQCLALSRLNHEGSGDWPAHCGSMETKIHEALGDVLDFDAGTLLPLTQIEDAFVRDAAGFSFVENREMLAEAGGHVVGIEDRDSGGVTQGSRPHHGDIHPRNDEDAGAAQV